MKFQANMPPDQSTATTLAVTTRRMRNTRSGISGAALRDPRPGDLVAVAVTGAYCYSLASNYNGAMRPPVVFCRNGDSRLVVRRETHTDFLARDVAP